MPPVLPSYEAWQSPTVALGTTAPLPVPHLLYARHCKARANHLPKQGKSSVHLSVGVGLVGCEAHRCQAVPSCPNGFGSCWSCYWLLSCGGQQELLYCMI